MSASDHAHRERAELADLLDDLGPDQPTLCKGWMTLNLAAHLVIRESRPDALAGLNGGPFAGWTRRLEDAEARDDYATIVQKVRSGPPLLSIFSLPSAEALFNLAEYVVHHEDVRRAQPGWTSRPVPPDLADELWNRIQVPGRRTFGKSPVGVSFIRTDLEAEPRSFGRAAPTVRIFGSPLELLVLAYGRTVVEISVDGAADEVTGLRTTGLIP